MIITLYIDDGIDILTKELEMGVFPNIGDSFYFEEVVYVVEDRGFYIGHSFSDSGLDSRVCYNLFLEESKK